jgi:hypothetical protein
MYAFYPTGYGYEIPGMTFPGMNVLLNRFYDMPDYLIYRYDVIDRDGSARWVIVVLWCGIVFDVFTFTRKRP